MKIKKHKNRGYSCLFKRSLKRKEDESQTTLAELKIGAIPQNSVWGSGGVVCYYVANKHLATARW